MYTFYLFQIEVCVVCSAQDHFIFLTVLIISMNFALSLIQMLVFLSLYVMLSILLSILVCATATGRFPLLNSILIKDCNKIIKRYVKEPEDMMCMTLMKQLSRLDVTNYNV